MRALASLGAAMVAAGLALPSAALTVADESGAVLWRMPAGEGTAVVLHYTNSLFNAPVWERFVVRDGRLHLLEVASRSEAVLEYNGHAPPYRRESARVVAPIRGVVLQTLPIRVGERGRPVLEVGGVTLPLYQAGAGSGLRIFVSTHPRLLIWASARAP